MKEFNRIIVFLMFIIVCIVGIVGCGKETTANKEKPTGTIAHTTQSGFTLKDLKNTSKFAAGALEHIFEGEINRRNQVVGYHYEGVSTAKAQVIPGTASQENKLGVYTGKVAIGNIKKDSNDGESTFYPKKWSPQQVVDAINEAYDTKEQRGSLYTGKSKTGIRINMYLDDKGKIVTAYPLY